MIFAVLHSGFQPSFLAKKDNLKGLPLVGLGVQLQPAVTTFIWKGKLVMNHVFTHQ